MVIGFQAMCSNQGTDQQSMEGLPGVPDMPAPYLVRRTARRGGQSPLVVSIQQGGRPSLLHRISGLPDGTGARAGPPVRLSDEMQTSSAALTRKPVDK